jgi:hypothetical protein
MYSNVNNLKNLHVANLTNYGNNYYQNVKISAKEKTTKKKLNHIHVNKSYTSLIGIIYCGERRRHMIQGRGSLFVLLKF